MGECLITRRGGVSYELPVLDENYPQDVSLTVIKGNTVSATFNAVFATHGKPAEYTYQWYVDGAAVEGANSAVFTMADLGETVNRSVYCEITNKAGTVTTRVATLKVTQHYTPVPNASYPADVTLNDGSTTSATFKVQIDTAGNPAEHTYQWYVDGAAVEGATGTTYTMSGLTKAATHTVFCKITNAAGTVQSRTATLAVKHTLLYKNGTRYEDVTGGFSAAGKDKNANDNQANAAPSITYNSDNFKITQSVAAGIVYTKNKIDLTNHSKLRIKGILYAHGSDGLYCVNVSVWSAIGTYADSNRVAGWQPSSSTTVQQNLSINISSVSGGCHIGFFFENYGSLKSYIQIYEMWLEG